MNQNSLLGGSIFNVIKTFFRIMFPVVTFSYASRILGEAGIGQVSFSNSVISCFSMIALLGMNYYGAREAAGLRDNKEKLSKFVQEMLIINACTTAESYLLFAFVLLTVPKLQSYRTLLLINSTAIALNGLSMEWLYQALEEYRYIAVRSVFFQAVSLGALFVFVHEGDDVVAYAMIHLIATSGSYILNFLNVKKHIYFCRYDHYEIKKHLKPLIWLFAMVVSIELYTVLDSTMLGFLQDNVAVGRYTAAVKANKIVISLITSSGVVLLPRFSYYIKMGQWNRVKNLIDKAYNFIFMLSIPCAVGMFVVSDEIILLFSGSRFASAGFTMRLLTPIVVLISFSTIVNLQTFVPMRKEKMIVKSTVVGAITNFSLNASLIPRYAENGAAVATFVAELAVALVCFWNVGKYYDRKKIFVKFYQYIIACIPIPIIAILMRWLHFHFMLRLSLTIIISALGYFGILLLFKNVYLSEVFSLIRRKCKKPYFEKANGK